MFWLCLYLPLCHSDFCLIARYCMELDTHETVTKGKKKTTRKMIFYFIVNWHLFYMTWLLPYLYFYLLKHVFSSNGKDTVTCNYLFPFSSAYQIWSYQFIFVLVLWYVFACVCVFKTFYCQEFYLNKIWMRCNDSHSRRVRLENIFCVPIFPLELMWYIFQIYCMVPFLFKQFNKWS